MTHQDSGFYYQASYIGGRVFIPIDAPQAVHDYFSSVSVWGGSDKVGDNFRSYEVRNTHDWMSY